MIEITCTPDRPLKSPFHSPFRGCAYSISRASQACSWSGNQEQQDPQEAHPGGRLDWNPCKVIMAQHIWLTITCIDTPCSI